MRTQETTPPDFSSDLRALEAFNEDPDYLGFPVADLHCHYGTSVSPKALWKLQRAEGAKIQFHGKRITDSREFAKLIRISPDEPREMTPYFEEVYHPILDRLTTGVAAAEQSFEAIFSGAYMNGVDRLEVRTNPMKHNGKDEFDLDDLIIAMTSGMQKALRTHQKLGGGIILCLAREWVNTGDPKKDAEGLKRHQTIVEKAIKFRHHGIVGIDIAGPDNKDGLPFPVEKHAELFDEAEKAGLGVTIHLGETEKSFGYATEKQLNPGRIGHGILAAYDPSIMAELRERGTVLEICPSSNLALNNASGWDQIGHIIRTFMKNEVKFTLSTDWPEIIQGGGLLRQYRELVGRGIIGVEDAKEIARVGMDATFIKQAGVYPHIQ